MQCSRLVRIQDIDSVEWDRLVQVSDTRTVFQSWGWHQAWWESFGGRNKLYLICAEENNRLCAIAPLMLITKAGRRILKFIGTGNADYCDFICSHNQSTAWEEMFKFIVSEQDSWDEMALDFIPDYSLTRELLVRNCQAHDLYLYPYGEVLCPQLAIAPDQRNVREIFKKRSMQRHCRYFAKKGGYEVLHLTKEEEIAPYLNDFFNQHIKRRQGTSVASVFTEPVNRDFYKNILKNLCPKKEIVFTVIKSQASVIAFHLGFTYDQTFLWYKPSFDINFSKYSPGEVLLKELLELTLARGDRMFDFTAGAEPFKMRFANQSIKNYSFKIFKTKNAYWGNKIMTHIRNWVKR
jgi:CelD/BcsL family acetyltransferase involved in cellulose biosynthesis